MTMTGIEWLVLRKKIVKKGEKIMTIYRGTQEIVLTPQELEAAFREKEHEYALENAKGILLELFGAQGDDGYFSEEYGIGISAFEEEPLSAKSAEILERIIKSYDEHYSDEYSVYEMWQTAIEQVLNEIEG